MALKDKSGIGMDGQPPKTPQWEVNGGQVVKKPISTESTGKKK
jgi:hypothetical protein